MVGLKIVFPETKIFILPQITENDGEPPQYVTVQPGQNMNAYVSPAVLQHAENLAKKY